MFTIDERTNARIVALQRLFADDAMHKLDLSATYPVFDTQYDHTKSDQLVDCVYNNQPFVDELIKKYAPQRPLNDMNPVDLNLMRIGFVEAFLLEQAPVKVCINEVVELAKRFSGETSFKLVNGVLGAIFEKEQENIKEYKAKHD